MWGRLAVGRGLVKMVRGEVDEGLLFWVPSRRPQLAPRRQERRRAERQVVVARWATTGDAFRMAGYGPKSLPFSSLFIIHAEGFPFEN